MKRKGVSRALVVKTLSQVLKQRPWQQAVDEGNTPISLTEALKNTADSGVPDDSLIREISYGVCRYYGSLDSVLSPFLDKPLKKKDFDIYLLLLAGLYQILYMRTPNHAAVDESVAASNILKKPWARGLINSILRKASKESERLLTRDEVEQARANHPKWLIKSIEQDWGSQSTSIFIENQQKPPMCIRLNTASKDFSSFEEGLVPDDVNCNKGLCALNSVYVSPPVAVTRLPGFEHGFCSVQDEAAQLAVESLLAGYKPAQKARVLDACAAPGGKTGHLGERLNPSTAELAALDINKSRTARIHENITRLGLKASIVHGDAKTPELWWDGELFDYILIDAPCSGTGVIRRHPDIKWLRRASDISALVQEQSSLLNSLWPLLHPEGILVYSTCSVLKTENENVAKAFLEAQNDAVEDTINATWGEAVSVGRQLLPSRNGPDGFYISRFRKSNVKTRAASE